MARMTLMSDTADRELGAVRRVVAGFDLVAGEPSVVAALTRYVAAGATATTLDLVGHSGTHGFLRIGDWILDDSPQTAASFDVLIRPLLEALGVTEIRLLGCSTAMSPRGWGAITSIARASRRRVCGTRRYISQQDYRVEGFISDDALVGTPGLRPERQDRIGFLPRAAMLIPINSLAMSSGPPLTNDQPILPVNESIAHKMLALVDGVRSWTLPGLLAFPSPIVLWSRANTVHRLEVLCDARALRVYGAYPDDEHGRIYLVRDPDSLTYLLERLDQPRSEIQARRR